MEPWMRRLEEMRAMVVKQNRKEALIRNVEEVLERHFEKLWKKPENRDMDEEEKGAMGKKNQVAWVEPPPPAEPPGSGAPAMALSEPELLDTGQTAAVLPKSEPPPPLLVETIGAVGAGAGAATARDWPGSRLPPCLKGGTAGFRHEDGRNERETEEELREVGPVCDLMGLVQVGDNIWAHERGDLHSLIQIQGPFSLSLIQIHGPFSLSSFEDKSFGNLKGCAQLPPAIPSKQPPWPQATTQTLVAPTLPPEPPEPPDEDPRATITHTGPRNFCFRTSAPECRDLLKKERKGVDLVSEKLGQFLNLMGQAQMHFGIKILEAGVLVGQAQFNKRKWILKMEYYLNQVVWVLFDFLISQHDDDKTWGKPSEGNLVTTQPVLTDLGGNRYDFLSTAATVIASFDMHSGCIIAQSAIVEAAVVPCQLIAFYPLRKKLQHDIFGERVKQQLLDPSCIYVWFFVHKHLSNFLPAGCINPKQGSLANEKMRSLYSLVLIIPWDPGEPNIPM